MKKLLILACLVFAFAACDSKEEKNIPPQCEITSPANGSEFRMGGEPLEIKWTASDKDGSIQSTALQLNGAAVAGIGKDDVSYTVPAEKMAAGTLKITLRVADDKNDTAESEITITVLPELLAPTCVISEPVEGTQIRLSAPLVVKGNAADEDGTIGKVLLKIGGKTISSITSVPFEYTVAQDEKTEGALSIVLEVEDNDGKTGRDEVNVTILPDLKAPTCVITSPAADSGFSKGDPITVLFSAADQDGTISKATLKYGETSRDITADVAKGSTVIDTDGLEVGQLTISVEVEDNDGLKARAQVAVRITAANAAPTCKLILPLNAVPYTLGDMVVKGEGEDSDGTISSVELKVGDKVITAVTSVPFTYKISQSDLIAGNVKVQLVVTDNGGAQGTAESNITVVDRYGTATDARDGKVYRTVRFGERVWMAENLAYLPYVNTWSEGSNVAANAGEAFYYVAGYAGKDVEAAKNTDAYKKGGVLYNGYAARNGSTAGTEIENNKPSGVQGICPDGWHLPSLAEFTEMFEWVKDQIPQEYAIPNGTKNVVGSLMTTEGWNDAPSSSVNTYPQLGLGGLNLFGFGVYPSGQRMAAGGFDHQGSYAFLWHATFIQANGNGGYITIRNNNYSHSQSYISSNRGHSVRCIMNY